MESQVQDVGAERDAEQQPVENAELHYEDLVEQDLVEDVSIDGMCGVY